MSNYGSVLKPCVWIITKNCFCLPQTLKGAKQFLDYTNAKLIR